MDPVEDVEALRRRLYRPDVTEDDRRRYASTLVVEAPAVVPAEPVLRRRPPLLRAAIAATVAAVAVAAFVAALLLGRPTPRPAVVHPVAAPTARTILPSQHVVARMGGATLPALRVEGSGPAEVPLDVSAAPFGGGHLLVVLSSSDERSVGWRADELVTRRDWTTYRRTIASAPLRDRFESTRPDEAAYAEDPPLWVTVQAPADAGWTLTVAFTR